MYSLRQDIRCGMKLKLLLSSILCVLLPFFAMGQKEVKQPLDSASLLRQEAAAKNWVDNMYSVGVEIKGDSVHFNDEARLIVADSNYRKIIYPEVYSWNIVQALMQRKMFKPMFWHLINLYYADPQNKELVLKMIVPFDQIFEMEKILTATFYTYSAFDPQVFSIENGKTKEVLRPDIAEHKLMATKAIVDQIYAQRNQAKNKQ